MLMWNKEKCKKKKNPPLLFMNWEWGQLVLGLSVKKDELMC